MPTALDRAESLLGRHPLAQAGRTVDQAASPTKSR